MSEHTERERGGVRDKERVDDIDREQTDTIPDILINSQTWYQHEQTNNPVYSFTHTCTLTHTHTYRHTLKKKTNERTRRQINCFCKPRFFKKKYTYRTARSRR